MIGQKGNLAATGEGLRQGEEEKRHKKKHSATDLDEFKRNKFARNVSQSRWSASSSFVDV